MVRGGPWRKKARGLFESISKETTGLRPVRPATSVAVTTKPCAPSESGVSGANGEGQGCRPPPSIEQRKLTGRLAAKPKVGRLILPSGGGDSGIETDRKRTRLNFTHPDNSPIPS